MNTTYVDDDQLVQQGWQCPFCRMVYAPHITSCFCQKTNIPYVPSPYNPYPWNPTCTCTDGDNVK